jgi:hypothetical protein
MNNNLTAADITYEFIDYITEHDAPFVESTICMMMEEHAKKSNIDVVELAYSIANTVSEVNKIYGKY